MLVYLLAIFLHINDIDYSFNINAVSGEEARSIIRFFEENEYQPANYINNYIPPIPQSDFVWPQRLITADSYVVVDQSSGTILTENDSDQVMPIASLTKLMTALVFLDYPVDMNGRVEIITADHNDVPLSKTYIRAGETMTVSNLLNLSLVGSDNDATSALARTTGLQTEEFVAKMNEKAELLGLSETSFQDVTGLSPNNKSTVKEYARVANYAFRNSVISQALHQSSYEFTTEQGRRLYINNTNKLLADQNLSIVGAKTGYIDEAGYTFACLSEKGGNPVMVVVFKSDSNQDRFDDAQALIEWAYSKYKWY